MDVSSRRVILQARLWPIKIVETDRKLSRIPGIPAFKTLLKLHGVIRTDVCRGPLRPLKEDEKCILEEIYAAYCEEEGIQE